MSFYAEVAGDVNDLFLTDIAEQVSITRNTPGAYDTATGTAAQNITVQTGRGVPVELPRLTNGATQIDGTLIQKGDKRLLLSNKGISPPKLDDVVLVSGINYTIKNVKTNSHAGTDVLYDCLLRV